MRKYLRQIAKERMKACGVGNVNRKMRRMNAKGEKLCRSFISGEYAELGERALCGMKTPKRRIRKIQARTA
jgi:hypothetical protein